MSQAFEGLLERYNHELELRLCHHSPAWGNVEPGASELQDLLIPLLTLDGFWAAFFPGQSIGKGKARCAQL